MSEATWPDFAALARAYALLGVHSEYHWTSAHKAYKARALLAAQAAAQPIDDRRLAQCNPPMRLRLPKFIHTNIARPTRFSSGTKPQ